MGYYVKTTCAREGGETLTAYYAREFDTYEAAASYAERHTAGDDGSGVTVTSQVVDSARVWRVVG